MSIQTFTSGQVLTAAQMNTLQANDYNQTVSTKTASYTLVAADVGTRIVMNSASATTITVNTSLFSAGDTLFLQNIGAGVCTVQAGTATVSSAGPLAIPQNGSGTLYFTSAGVSIYYPSAVTATASGLTLISSTTIGSAVSSVTVSNAFNSTYDNYRIIVSGGVGSTTQNFSLQLGSTTTGYYWGGANFNFSGTVTGIGLANTSSFTQFGVMGTGILNAIGDISNPNLAKITIVQGSYCVPTAGNSAFYYAGFLNDTTQYTAFTLTGVGGSTMTGGTIKVYGYANS